MLTNQLKMKYKALFARILNKQLNGELESEKLETGCNIARFGSIVHILHIKVYLFFIEYFNCQFSIQLKLNKSSTSMFHAHDTLLTKSMVRIIARGRRLPIKEVFKIFHCTNNNNNNVNPTRLLLFSIE
ncbi:hypothetical protein T11_2268 [Trichinella zimbabwensis]|uniref:Uncharacterized protein n=1 Tax=Trichinella zimbabwensis TaxID=268475 RepID=A0A0V1HTB3_9BILA|nr:hypothetical protein T11_2268 [Trichinella zimbabwensis]